MDKINGRVALITGGAHRVGKAIAVALGAQGARIALHYNSSADKMRQSVDEFSSLGYDVKAFQADLSQPDSPKTLVDQVVAHFGALDILVNSAAVMVRTPVDSVTPAEWDRMFALNTRAPFFLAQAARSALAQSNGVIINIADLAAFETWPNYIPHGITKAAVVQMTRALARTFAPEIRVNAVAPGAVLLPDDWSEESAQRMAESTPLKRLGSPEDVADAVTYLVGAGYVTGEVIIVDGGRHVRK